jgi:hypothetical protein
VPTTSVNRLSEQAYGRSRGRSDRVTSGVPGLPSRIAYSFEPCELSEHRFRRQSCPLPASMALCHRSCGLWSRPCRASEARGRCLRHTYTAACNPGTSMSRPKILGEAKVLIDGARLPQTEPEGSSKVCG